MTGIVNSIGLSMLDPVDPDDRRLLIEADHAMLQQALVDGLGEVVLDGHVMKPSLHIALHEIVAERLWADDPPETWSSAQRLFELGYDRHEVLHMLMSVVSDEIFRAMQPNRHRRTPAGPGPRWQHLPKVGRRSARRRLRTGRSAVRSSALTDDDRDEACRPADRQVEHPDLTAGSRRAP